MTLNCLSIKMRA